MAKFKYSKLWLVVGVLLLANFAIIWGVIRSAPRQYARLYFFDVGQGDGIYLRTPQGNDVLIDTGPGDVILEKLGRVMPSTDRTLELVILTHPHADHISGMIEILKRYQVGMVMLPKAGYESETYAYLLELLDEKHTKIIAPTIGRRVVLDRALVFDVYYPLVGAFGKSPKDINDVSIVGRLAYGNMDVLLSGDAGKDVEVLLERLGLPLDVEILKVGHHGSRHSTGGALITQTTPDYAVISAGKNSYGHPHEEVLGILMENKIPILRTDEHGDISFRIYPDRLELIKQN